MEGGSEGAVFEPVDGQVFYADKLSFKQLLRLLEVGREVPSFSGGGGKVAGGKRAREASSGGVNSVEASGVAVFAYEGVSFGDVQGFLGEGLRVVFDGDLRQVFVGDDDGFFDFYGSEIDNFIEMQVDAAAGVRVSGGDDE